MDGKSTKMNHFSHRTTLISESVFYDCDFLSCERVCVSGSSETGNEINPSGIA